jgi:hypothetical protein
MTAGRGLAVLGAAIVVLVASAPAHAGMIRYVDDDGLDGFNCTNAPYTTISAAVAASKQGDEIRVCPGVYEEQVVVPFDMTIRGEAFGSRRAVIRPTAMPATLPGLDGGNPIAAAILDDGHLLRMSDVDIDLANNTVAGCSPVVAGIYVRNAWASVQRIEIYHAIVNGRPDCDSGIGLLVESGPKEIVLGQPVFGKARFIAKSLRFEDFQKAGFVGIGPNTLVRMEGGVATRQPAGAGETVPIGYELANGAKGKIINSSADHVVGATTGKLSAGMLVYKAGKITLRRDLVEDNQVGVMVVGDNARVKRGKFNRHSSDAIILLGDSNLVTQPDVDGASISGAFIMGDHNVVKGGFFTNAPIGLWFLGGIGNAFYGITWGTIPLETRGVYGGLRDLRQAAAPFLMRCTGTLSCDDGNACLDDVCDLTSGTCSHPVTSCDDANVCTTDSCDPLVGCIHTPVAGTCDDASLCTTGDICVAGVCTGTPTPAAQTCALGNGNVCDGIEQCNPATGLCDPGTPLVCNDGNPCTTDTCNTVSGCQFANVADSTPCGIGMTCLAGVCQ